MRVLGMLLAAIVGAVGAASPQTGAPSSAGPADDKKPSTTVTISGCLMRNGYATFMVADARLDAIGGKAVGAATTDKVGAEPAGPTKWILDEPGNVGVHVGEKVQVIGRTEWTPADQASAAASQTPSLGPPAPLPHLTVQSLKMLAPSCT